MFCVVGRRWFHAFIGATRGEFLGGSEARLKLQPHGRETRIAAKPALDIDLVKPPAAKGDFLLVGFERIREQWPHRRDAALKGTDTISGPVVTGYLLIEKSAHSGRQAERKMLVERRLDMQLVPALIIRRGIA